MSELVLHATLEQKNALEGAYANGEVLQFVEDADGNWVVNTHTIENGNFLEIREQLSALPKIIYNPKIVML